MRYFEVDAPNQEWNGCLVEVDDDATEEQINEAAFEVVAEYVNYGLVELDGPSGNPLNPDH